MPERQRAHRGTVAAMLAAGLLAAASVSACGEASATPTAWERIDPDPGGVDGPRRIADWRGGYVALGPGGVWTSDDGRSWSVAAIPGAQPDAWQHIVATQDAVVAVFTAMAARDRVGAEAWLSPDGSAWERSPDDAALQPGPAFKWVDMWVVATGPIGLIAIGQEGQETATRIVSWWSRDGSSWTRTAPPPGLRVGRDAVATEDGFVLAGARAEGFEPVPDGGFWFSTDGLAWQAVPDDPSLVDAEAMTLAARGRTVVAVGYRRSGAGTEGAAWTSPDGGKTWAAVALPLADDAPGADVTRVPVIMDVVATPSGFVAVGYFLGHDPRQLDPDGEPARQIRGLVWRSSDGRAWELLPDRLIDETELGPRFVPHGLFGIAAQPDGQLLIIGATPELGATIWLAPG